MIPFSLLRMKQCQHHLLQNLKKNMVAGPQKIFRFGIFVYSRQTILQHYEFCSMPTDAPGCMVGFCCDNQVISPCRKSETSHVNIFKKLFCISIVGLKIKLWCKQYSPMTNFFHCVFIQKLQVFYTNHFSSLFC